MIDAYETPGRIEELLDVIPEAALEIYKNTQNHEKDPRILNQEWNGLFRKRSLFGKIIAEISYFFCNMLLSRDPRAFTEWREKRNRLIPIREEFFKKIQILTEQCPVDNMKAALEKLFKQGNVNDQLDHLAFALVRMEHVFKNICRCAGRNTIRRALTDLDEAQAKFDSYFEAACAFGLAGQKDRQGIFDRATAIFYREDAANPMREKLVIKIRP